MEARRGPALVRPAAQDEAGATDCVAAGTDLFVLQRWLGHESSITTTDTYARLFPDQQRAAADAVGRAMRELTTLAPAPER
jgi:integrase